MVEGLYLLVVAYFSLVLEFAIVRCRQLYLPLKFTCVIITVWIVWASSTEPSVNCRTFYLDKLFITSGDFLNANLRSVRTGWSPHLVIILYTHIWNFIFHFIFPSIFGSTHFMDLEEYMTSVISKWELITTRTINGRNDQKLCMTPGVFVLHLAGHPGHKV